MFPTHPASARCLSCLVALVALGSPSWLGVSAYFISFSSTCQATEDVPPSPEASCVTCVSPGPAGRQAGPAAGSAQASRDAEAPSKPREWLLAQVWGSWGSALHAHLQQCLWGQAGRAGCTLLAHPVPLSPSMTPRISILHGEAGCNVWIMFVSSFS